MKSPVETIDGKIVDYDVEKGEITIKAKFDDWDRFFSQGYKSCKIGLVDSRRLSSKQRKSCYVLLQDIANWAGMHLEETKRVMKDKFLEECVDDDLGIQDFSLKDAPMALVSSFQEFLTDFILSYDVPTKAVLKDLVGDEKYVYQCIRNRKCCVCGKGASLYTNNGLTIPVCGTHRIELLTEGRVFYEKYHVEPIAYSENEDMS